MNYTIDGLLDFYAVKGTKECEEFLDALEIAGARWPNGKPPRADSIDGECVSLDAVDRNIGNCRKKYYEENGYKLFIPESISKYEQWSIYNNTMPLCELTDEQAAMLFNAWRGDGEVECKGLNGEFRATYELWCIGAIYRIKPKSERELFIENSSRIMHSVEGDGLINDITLGALYDNGLRYKDPTKLSEV